jgi:hypothetical protein
LWTRDVCEFCGKTLDARKGPACRQWVSQAAERHHGDATEMLALLLDKANAPLQHRRRFRSLLEPLITRTPSLPSLQAVIEFLVTRGVDPLEHDQPWNSAAYWPLVHMSTARDSCTFRVVVCHRLLIR